MNITIKMKKQTEIFKELIGINTVFFIISDQWMNPLCVSRNSTLLSHGPLH